MTPQEQKFLIDLLCDLPERSRGSTELVMLRGYFDESGTGQPPVFVLAGYISTAEKWAEFSTAWDQALNISPRIEYFKMDEAMNLKGQFGHWSEERRNQRVQLFIDIIQKHAIVGAAISIKQDEFHRVFNSAVHRPWPYPMNTLYFHAVMETLQAIGAHRARMGLNGPIQYIFDDGMREKGVITDMWDIGKNDPEWTEIFNTIGIPYFLDDKKVLPLQAADMLAWVIRKRWMESVSGSQEIFQLTTWSEPVPILFRDYNEAAMWNWVKMFNRAHGRFISYTYGRTKGIG